MILTILAYIGLVLGGMAVLSVAFYAFVTFDFWVADKPKGRIVGYGLTVLFIVLFIVLGTLLGPHLGNGLNSLQ